MKNLNFTYPDVSAPANAPQGKIAARFMSIEQVSKTAKAGVETVLTVLGDGAKKEDKEDKDKGDEDGEANIDAASDVDDGNDTAAANPPPTKSTSKPAVDNSALIAKLTGALSGAVKGDDDDEDDGEQSDSGSDVSAPMSGYTSGEASDDDALKDWPDPDAASRSEGEGAAEEEEDEEDDGGGNNAILDSLNAGVGYISGGSDDISDAEEKVAPRKNRRGQRARRM